jgi:membrane protein required for colicin V production
MIGPLTFLDAGLIAVAIISGLLAMYRGLTRELLSIVSWAVAALAVLYFILNHKKFAEDMATQMGAPLAIAQIAIGAIIFLIVLIVVHLLTARLSDAILDSSVGMVDRILGFVFGIARGFVLVVIPYMFFEAFFPDQAQHPVWVRDSKSLPYIQSTGNAIRATLETHMPSGLTNPAPAPTTGEQQG